MNSGKLRELMDTLGQLVILSVLWMLLTIPVITAVPAAASLYYAVVKAVRKGFGDPCAEFFRCFRRIWKKGIVHSLLAAVLLVVMLLGVRIISAAYWLAVCALAAALIYLGPVLSRFDLAFWKLWSLSFVAAVRSLHWTVLIGFGAAAVAWTQFYLLPMAVVLILPGAVCLGISYPMEKALGKFMPPKENEDDAWYFE